MTKDSNRYISHGLYTDPPTKRASKQPQLASSIFKLAFDWEMLDFLLSKLKNETFNVTMHCNDFRSAHCGHHLKKAGTSKADLDKHIIELYYTVTDMMDEFNVPMPDKLVKSDGEDNVH